MRYKVIYLPAHGDLTKKKTKPNKQKPHTDQHTQGSPHTEVMIPNVFQFDFQWMSSEETPEVTVSLITAWKICIRAAVYVK